MRALILPALCALPLLAQLPPGVAPELFSGDPRDAAVFCADKARVRAQDDSRRLAAFGRAYLAAGELARAEDAFARALRRGGSDPETLSAIAAAWLKHHEPARALEAAKRLEGLGPKAAPAARSAALALLEAGQETEAAALMARVEAWAPKDWRAFADFGEALLRRHKPEAAAPWFQKAVKLASDDEALWTRLAQAYTAALEAR